MKILMINEKYSSEGGSEYYLWAVVEGLRKRGHEVFVIYDEKKFAESSQNLFYVPFLNTKAVLEIVYKVQPNVINLQNVFNNDLYRFLPNLFPTVRFVHDHRTYSPGSSSMHFRSNTICEEPLSWSHQILYAYLEKCMSRNPFKIVALIKKRKELLQLQNNLKKVMVNSNYVLGRLEQNGVKKDLLEVVPLFADLPDSKRKIVKPERAVILYCGRLFIEKGVEYAIKAMKKVEAELWILGTGWDEERLKNITKEEGLADKVKFFGWVNYEDLSSYYRVCDFLVMPSIWPEPFGLSGIQAMRMGKSVVAFNVGGIKDWLKDGQVGYLVERSNQSKLEEKMNLLVKDKNLAKKLGEQARIWVEEKFTLEKHLVRLEEIYQEVRD